MNPRPKKDETKVWRYLTNFWTFVTFVVVLIDFFEHGTYEFLLGPTVAIYVAILAIFSAEKEFERWHWKNSSKHMGEVYVALWTILMVAMLALSYVSADRYHIHEHVFSAYIAVLGILAITRKSRAMFRAMRKERG